MGRWAGLPAGASVRLAPRLVYLRPYSSHYRNRESLVRRQAAERHLEDGGIYRKRWWTRLSCHRFVANQVRLALFILAYNPGNLLRRLCLPRAVKHWSLRSL